MCSVAKNGKYYDNDVAWTTIHHFIIFLQNEAVESSIRTMQWREWTIQLSLYWPCSCFLCTSLYFILTNYKKKWTAEHNRLMVTLLHAIIAASLTFISVYVTGPLPFSYINQPNSRLHITIISIGAGYYLFDTVWYFQYRRERYIVIAHHVLSLLVLGYASYTGTHGCELSAILGAFSFLSLAGLLTEKASARFPHRAVIFDSVYISAFMLIRLVLGSALCWHFWFHPTVSIFLKLGGLLFLAMNLEYGYNVAVSFKSKYLQN